MFKNAYTNRIKKDEFIRKFKENKKVTDDSQIAQASIVEMAKKYGIDAIITQANKTYLDNTAIQDKLYGHDLTNGFKSKEEMLNIKKKVGTLFENIPARIRKEVFNDNVINFVEAYTHNDEQKLEKLNKLGIVSDTQLQKVKAYNVELKQKKQDEQTRINFINQLEKAKEGLYENFKTTGNLNINLGNNSAEDI